MARSLSRGRFLESDTFGSSMETTFRSLKKQSPYAPRGGGGGGGTTGTTGGGGGSGLLYATPPPPSPRLRSPHYGRSSGGRRKHYDDDDGDDDYRESPGVDHRRRGYVVDLRDDDRIGGYDHLLDHPDDRSIGEDTAAHARDVLSRMRSSVGGGGGGSGGRQRREGSPASSRGVLASGDRGRGGGRRQRESSP